MFECDIFKKFDEPHKQLSVYGMVVMTYKILYIEIS